MNEFSTELEEKVILTTGAKAAKIFNIVMSLEFACVAIWAFLAQKIGILFIAAILAIQGIIELYFWIYFKRKGAEYEDEYMSFTEDNSRVIAAFAGFLMFAQLAILEVTIGTVIRVIDAFIAAYFTYLSVFIVHNVITFSLDRGEENEEQVESSTDQA